MAYIYDDDDKRKQQMGFGAPLPPMKPAAAPGGLGVSPIGQSQPGAPAQAGSNAGARGTGFVNLDQYFKLNQQGGQDMANKLTGGLDKEAGEIDSGLKGLQSSYEQAVQAGTQQGGYKGPNSMSEFSPEFGKLRERASALSSKARGISGQGIGTAINQQLAKGRYSAGSQRLDSFLAGGMRGADKYSGLDKAFGLADSNSRGMADKGRNARWQLPETMPDPIPHPGINVPSVLPAEEDPMRGPYRGHPMGPDPAAGPTWSPFGGHEAIVEEGPWDPQSRGLPGMTNPVEEAERLSAAKPVAQGRTGLEKVTQALGQTASNAGDAVKDIWANLWGRR